jgi:hypothetical protein
MAAAKKPWKYGASSGHITNLKQSIFVFQYLWVNHSGLFSYLVGWHASAVTLPPTDVIFALLACHLNDIIFCLHQE